MSGIINKVYIYYVSSHFNFAFRNNDTSTRKAHVSPNVYQTSSLPGTTFPGNNTTSSTSSERNTHHIRLPGNHIDSTSPGHGSPPTTVSGYNLPENRPTDRHFTTSNRLPNFPATSRDQVGPNKIPLNKAHHGQSIPGQFAGQSVRAAQAGVFRSALQSAGLQFKKPMPSPGTVTKDASDDGDVLLNRLPLAAEHCK